MQKYKVFFNEKSIVFTSGSNITLTKPNCKIDENSSNDAVLVWLETFVKDDISEAVLEHSSTEQFFQTFKSAFLIVNAAGGVVIKNGKLLLIKRNGKWDLPKGCIEKGELKEQAAVREVAEECGITGHKIIRKLQSTYHIYKSPYKESKGTWIFKETFWYEMEYTGTQAGNPQYDEGITEVRWFNKSDLNEVIENTYENLKQIIEIYRS